MISKVRTRVFCLPVSTQGEHDRTFLRFEAATRMNLQDAVGLRGPEVASAFSRFIRHGQYGVFAYDGTALVAHGWAIFGSRCRGRANGYFPLASNEVLIHYCFVNPERRGQGIYTALLRELSARVAELGGDRLLIDAPEGNRSSIRAINRIGGEEIGEMQFITVLGRPVLGSKRRF